MKLEEVEYFSSQKELSPELFNYAQKVIEISAKNFSDMAEINKKLENINKANGNEHLRQASNFLAELFAYYSLYLAGKDPHWVPTAKEKMPDIESKGYPIEVKHLNSPRAEHEAIANGELIGGSADRNYHKGLEKKIQYFISDSRKKFESYNRIYNEKSEPKGILYIYYSKSIDAIVTDTIEWEIKMHERVRILAESCLQKNDKIALEIYDIDSIYLGSF